MALSTGADPMDLGFRRVLNVAYVMFTRGMVPEQREHFDNLMAWPEEQKAKQEEGEDRQLRQAAAVLGRDLDRMAADAWAARQAGLRELEQRRVIEASKAAHLRKQEEELLEKSPREWVAEAESEVEEAS